ncbi:hypothetical protein SAMN05192589_102126 [Paracidovorax valerianellae]|uniref:HEPN/Toprim N-terminal domain-containing protein n=1 Tax=Paracidovorax valerianellae TaxID=187868 RepID=A0A1G6LBN8_9BURK|nr:HEPN/Toprim-associated domain-containing protein [Paracidovorax valerianellae]SDC40690.1 hypothetical protein SAMN05192589_102126 [Paracidovorax valerianellae]
MSTPITLSIGDIDLTYNTGHMGIDHGHLFQEIDRKRRRRPTIDYSYFEQHPEDDLAQMEMCLVRPLITMLPRLELLGHTLDTVKEEYELRAAEHQERKMYDAEDPGACDMPLLGFDHFLDFVRMHAICDLSNELPDDVGDADRDGKFGRFSSDAVSAFLPKLEWWDAGNSYSERSHFGSLLDFLHPYSVLRVLAENPANLELDVVWDYGAFVSAGWEKNEHFITGARRAQTYLIATEGTSDTHILKKAIALLKPDVEDFFRFIDLAERHPFPGTGNLVKFAEGLAKIDVHNRVVFLFDNDAEGIDAYRALQRMALPANMRALALPDLHELREFPAQGPEGVIATDINGRAAAIECYLDLRLKGFKQAQVTWTNYKDKLGIYQGSLDHKDSYAKAFYEATAETIADGSYDVSKLRIALDALLRECIQLAKNVSNPSHGARGA